MLQHVTAARAITAYAAHRSIVAASLVALASVIGLVLLTWLLVYVFSDWFWLLLIPIGALATIGLGVLTLATVIVRLIYPRNLFTKDQKKHLKLFMEKTMSVLDARSISLPFLAIRTIWDIIRHRDATTVRKLIDDSSTLAADYRRLEASFTKHRP